MAAKKSYDPTFKLYIQKPDRRGRLLSTILRGKFPKSWRHYFYEEPLYPESIGLMRGGVLRFTYYFMPLSTAAKTLSDYANIGAPLFIALNNDDGTMCRFVVIRSVRPGPIRPESLLMQRCEMTSLPLALAR